MADPYRCFLTLLSASLPSPLRRSRRAIATETESVHAIVAARPARPVLGTFARRVLVVRQTFDRIRRHFPWQTTILEKLVAVSRHDTLGRWIAPQTILAKRSCEKTSDQQNRLR